MRVIAGSARSVPLVAPRGKDVTRPTTDKIKETLFNILNFDLPGSNFLDLFAGSGGIGIEALSRGAEYVAFVDNSKDAADCINYNLKHTKLDSKGQLLKTDYLRAIATLESMGKKFEFVFMDPPYEEYLEKNVLERLSASDIIDKETVIIVEASDHTDFSYVDDLGYTIDRIKNYKSKMHVFMHRNN